MSTISDITNKIESDKIELNKLESDKIELDKIHIININGINNNDIIKTQQPQQEIIIGYMRFKEKRITLVKKAITNLSIVIVISFLLYLLLR
jgi:hypothetical protein